MQIIRWSLPVDTGLFSYPVFLELDAVLTSYDTYSVDIFVRPWRQIEHASILMLTSNPLNTLAVSIVAALGALVIAYRWLGECNQRVPPGPRRYPLIGNALNFPMRGWAKVFPEWHRKYGTHKF